MTHEKKSGPVIAPVISNALIWAAVIIASSLILAGQSPDQKQSLMMLFIMGWFATNAAITSNGKSLKAEWACIRRRFGGSE